MFKLLALHVLGECSSYIQKCLHPNTFYYLCTDYRFEVPGKVYRGNKFFYPLQDDFYALRQNYNFMEKQLISPIVNINAIVGKNGDGKSTIVELIIRLINNYIAHEQINRKFQTEQPLKYVDGVHAELYFQVDKNIYKLYNRGKKCGVVKVASIKDSPSFDVLNENESSDVLDGIYTFVSNYSHYSYNLYDFRQEGDNSLSSNAETSFATCWLNYIFHENDGYVTPISIHPLRKNGMIDINKETYLSKQRLLYLFVKEKDGQNTFRNILGKQAVAIKLIPIPTSKLLEHSIKDFFYANKEDDSSLDWAITPLENIITSINNESQENEIEEESQEKLLNIENLYEVYIRDIDSVFAKILEGDDFPQDEQKRYRKFLKKITQLLDAENKVRRKKIDYKYRPNKSNIQSLIEIVDKLYSMTQNTSKTHYFFQKYNEQYITKSVITYYNLRQLSRLHTIYKIALFYRIDTKLLTTEYSKLTNVQRAKIYKIYKTLTIFETYPKYIEKIQSREKKRGSDSCFEYNADELNSLMKQLDYDRTNKSHIVRKLEQVDNYIKQPTDLYDEPDLVIPNMNDGMNAKYKIKDISCIAKYYQEENIDIFHLVPPVFEYDIVLKDGNSYVELNSLSSGEKQLLHSIGAILYHMQNVDSTQVYESINVILEEIELYFHPEYQRQFISHLLEQIYGIQWNTIKNINITFVTHSPFLLSDIPKSNVLFLKEGKPSYEMQENTFGANIHSLLKNGFFLPNLPIGEFAYQKIDELFRKLNERQYDDEDVAQIRQEISIIGEPYLREQLYRLLRINS